MSRQRQQSPAILRVEQAGGVRGRDAYGVPLLVDLLGCARAVEDGLALAACDALTALAAGSAANKAAVREAWALPLLVRLLAPPVRAWPAAAHLPANDGPLSPFQRGAH